MRPRIESIPDNFQEPRTGVAAVEAREESESAQICFLDHILRIPLIARQPARQVVSGVKMR
jgi:hypothetical protein